VDIMDLAEAGTATATAAGSDSSPAGFQLVSGSEPAPGSGGVPPGAAPPGTPVDEASRSEPVTAPSTRPSYGYDPEYRWLRGKLEYSQIDRRWKLRYIPVDGSTDRFGGSVVLADPSVLTGFERGDFVELRGHLGDPEPEKGFAPTYEVAQIRPLSEAAL
jgi:hypothetical protein